MIQKLKPPKEYDFIQNETIIPTEAFYISSTPADRDLFPIVCVFPKGGSYLV